MTFNLVKNLVHLISHGVTSLYPLNFREIIFPLGPLAQSFQCGGKQFAECHVQFAECSVLNKRNRM